MADDQIENVDEGEAAGYVADSDEENQKGLSTRKITEFSSIMRANAECGTTLDKMQTMDQISVTNGVDEMEPDQEPRIYLTCAQNSYSDRTLSRVNRSRIRKLYNNVTSDATYIGSQEPGELSQANAMDVVDKLLCDTDSGLCHDIDPSKTLRSNSLPISSVRGTHRLAKWVTSRTLASESRAFDWVESIADDETGNEYREGMKFSSESRGTAGKLHSSASKPTHFGSGIYTFSAEMSRNKATGSITCLNASNLSCPETPNPETIPNSSSICKLHRYDTERNSLLVVAGKKLMTEPPKQSSEVANVGVMDETYDIGPNTQMAAEAMEALLHGSYYGPEEVTEPKYVNETSANDLSIQKRVYSICDLDVNLRCYKRRKPVSNKLNRRGSGSSKKEASNSRVKHKVFKVNGKAKGKRSKWENETHLLDDQDSDDATELKRSSKQNEECDPVGCSISEIEKAGISSNANVSATKRLLCDLPFYAIPVAPRTKRLKTVRNSNWMKVSSGYNAGGKMVDDKNIANILRTRNSRKCVDKCLNQDTRIGQQVGNHMEVEGAEQLHERKLTTSCLKTCVPSPFKRRRFHQMASGKSNICAKPKNRSPVIVQIADIVKSSKWCDGSEVIVKSCHEIAGSVRRKKRSVPIRKASSVSGVRRISSVCPPFTPHHEKDFKPDSCEVGLGLAVYDTSVISHRADSENVHPLEMAVAPVFNAQVAKANAKESIISSFSKRQGTGKISYRKRVPKPAIARELIRLEATEAAATWLLKDPRRRNDMSKVCVLLSNNLNDDVIKQQKKILARFKIPIASSVTDATHFIADRFARTKNMLEAMAMGKPVVTHMWLDSCARASYFIDEKFYILRDLKKEKEIGFSMHVSLARARQHPLLQGRRVLITPNVKPSSEVVGSLVKAAKGQVQPVESVCKPAMENDKTTYDPLVISSEEDFAACTSLLDKGVKVFSSDLLLNGIIVQRLEFDRYRLFVKRHV